MINLSRNMDIISSILWKPEIWAEIAPQGIEPFSIPYQEDCRYYLVNDTDGVVIFHPYMDGLKIHANFPKEKRGRKAYEALEESIQAVFRDGVPCVYAEVDKHLTHVIRCAMALGFKKIESGDRVLMVRRKLNS